MRDEEEEMRDEDQEEEMGEESFVNKIFEKQMIDKLSVANKEKNDRQCGQENETSEEEREKSRKEFNIESKKDFVIVFKDKVYNNLKHLHKGNGSDLFNPKFMKNPNKFHGELLPDLLGIIGNPNEFNKQNCSLRMEVSLCNNKRSHRVPARRIFDILNIMREEKNFFTIRGVYILEKEIFRKYLTRVVELVFNSVNEAKGFYGVYEEMNNYFLKLGFCGDFLHNEGKMFLYKEMTVFGKNMFQIPLDRNCKTIRYAEDADLRETFNNEGYFAKLKAIERQVERVLYGNESDETKLFMIGKLMANYFKRLTVHKIIADRNGNFNAIYSKLDRHSIFNQQIAITMKYSLENLNLFTQQEIKFIHSHFKMKLEIERNKTENINEMLCALLIVESRDRNYIPLAKISKNVIQFLKECVEKEEEIHYYIAILRIGFSVALLSKGGPIFTLAINARCKSEKMINLFANKFKLKQVTEIDLKASKKYEQVLKKMFPNLVINNNHKEIIKKCFEQQNKIVADYLKKLRSPSRVESYVNQRELTLENRIKCNEEEKEIIEIIFLKSDEMKAITKKDTPKRKEIPTKDTPERIEIPTKRIEKITKKTPKRKEKITKEITFEIEIESENVMQSSKRETRKSAKKAKAKINNLQKVEREETQFYQGEEEESSQMEFEVVQVIDHKQKGAIVTQYKVKWNISGQDSFVGVDKMENCKLFVFEYWIGKWNRSHIQTRINFENNFFLFVSQKMSSLSITEEEYEQFIEDAEEKPK